MRGGARLSRSTLPAPLRPGIFIAANFHNNEDVRPPPLSSSRGARHAPWAQARRPADPAADAKRLLLPCRSCPTFGSKCWPWQETTSGRRTSLCRSTRTVRVTKPDALNAATRLNSSLPVLVRTRRLNRTRRREHGPHQTRAGDVPQPARGSGHHEPHCHRGQPKALWSANSVPGRGPQPRPRAHPQQPGQHQRHLFQQGPLPERHCLHGTPDAAAQLAGRATRLAHGSRASPARS